MDWLKGLELGLWWRAVFAAGFALAVAAMAAKDRDAMIIGFGLAAFGWGEWLNRPRVGGMDGPYLKSWYEWRPCISGLVLDAIGLGLIGLGFYRLLTA